MNALISRTGILGRARALLALGVAFTALSCMASRPPPPPHAPAICGPLLPFLVLDHTGDGERTIYGQPNGSALLFLGGLNIDADGAPNAYHPDDVSGLDALSNAGRPGNWWALATDARGRPIVQGAGDPFPGFYVSTTTLTNPGISDPASPRRYVDARLVPYVVLPGGHAAEKAYKTAGIKPGDLAMVYNLRTQRMASAVWADTGPPGQLGEGSIKLAELLGYEDTSPRTGGTTDNENIFLVFGGSAPAYQTDPTRIDEAARRLFAMWGGRERLQDCAGQLGAH